MSRKLAYGQAFNEAVRQEMAANDNVFCAGEDIGAFGGVFQTYAGLQAEFGERRVVDTPISEQAIIGLGVGAAVTGLRPIVDIMFMDFLCVAFDQIVNQAAKLKYMFGGAATIPADDHHRWRRRASPRRRSTASRSKRSCATSRASRSSTRRTPTT